MPVTAPGPGGAAVDPEVAAYWADREERDAPVGGARPVRLPGGRVTLSRVGPGHYFDDRGREPRRMENRTRYAVEVDGTLRGHVALPAGVGTRWRAWTLGDLKRRHGAWHVVGRKELSDPTMAGDGRDGLASRFAGWADAGLAPTLDEVRALHQEMAAAEHAEARAWAARKAEQDASHAQWQSGERARRDAAWRASCGRRARAREALRSVLDGSGVPLTDAQAAGLRDALAEVADDPAAPSVP